MERWWQNFLIELKNPLDCNTKIMKPKRLMSAGLKDSLFLTYLAVHDKKASSIQGQAFCAILFLYKSILKIDIGEIKDIVFSKKTNAYLSFWLEMGFAK